MSYFLWKPKVKSLIMKKPLVLVKHSPSVVRPSARRGQAVDRGSGHAHSAHPLLKKYSERQLNFLFSTASLRSLNE